MKSDNIQVAQDYLFMRIQKIFIWVFPDEVNKNRIIDDGEFARHMTLVNKQGDGVSMQMLNIHTVSINTFILNLNICFSLFLRTNVL